MEDSAALVTLKYDVQRRQTALLRLPRVRAALAAEQKRQRHLTEQLHLEQEDVKRMEGTSFASLIASVRGIRDERLRVEREEEVAARLRLDESVAAIAALQAQAAELESEFASLEGAEARYEDALAAREQQVLGSDSAARRRFTAIADELGTLQAAARELHEAAAAGEAADKALAHVEALLEKAADWGTWDMLGGGMIATAMKHERLGQAREAAARARESLQRLGIELSDLGMSGAGLEAQVGEFADLADFWMDGLIADWFVQNRIDEARSRVQGARKQVRGLVNRLRDDAIRPRRRAAELETERRALLEAA
jgi:hypothetical protein